ncbi:MAG: carbon-nitrogen hydrolase family protein [Magnetovibrionaceae bacterium]
MGHLAACLQLSSTSDPEENVARVTELARRAAREGASLIATPETTNFIQPDRAMQASLARRQAKDPSLRAFRDLAADLGVWLLIGSLVLRDRDTGQLVNRSFLIDGLGEIKARYDKIHLFDVDLGQGEAYRESDTYRGGMEAVWHESPLGPVGLTICYDLRFPALYRDLASRGAQVIAVPSAFTVPTGRAHWEVLLRARAIETGSYILAPAQTGTHAGGRKTWGHSMIVDPWGKVIAQAGDREGEIIMAEIEPPAVAEARMRIPALTTERTWI